MYFIFFHYIDVVSIKKTGEHFRILYDVKGRFILHRITDEEAKVYLINMIFCLNCLFIDVNFYIRLCCMHIHFSWDKINSGYYNFLSDALHIHYRCLS